MSIPGLRPGFSLPDHNGYIYVLRAANRYKIGRALFPARLRVYQTESPFTVHVVCCVRVADYEHVERQLHQHFRKRRVKGLEWYQLTPRHAWRIKRLLEELASENGRNGWSKHHYLTV